jgi:hypothetical protein
MNYSEICTTGLAKEYPLDSAILDLVTYPRSKETHGDIVTHFVRRK